MTPLCAVHQRAARVARMTANICQGPTGAITASSSLPGSPLFTFQQSVIPTLYRWVLQHKGQVSCARSLDRVHDWLLTATETLPILHQSPASIWSLSWPSFSFLCPLPWHSPSPPCSCALLGGGISFCPKTSLIQALLKSHHLWSPVLCLLWL